MIESSTLVLTLASVSLVSAISLIGVFFISMNVGLLRRFLFILVSIAVGALLGDAFLHLLPEATATLGVERAGLGLLAGIGIFFALEKVLHWHHHHGPHTGKLEECEDCDEHIAPFGKLAIVSDLLHNVLDGAIIAAGFFISVEVGIATTIAVALHEIPQEIGDFGVLLHAGFSKGRALLVNFASALSAFVGVAVVLILGTSFEFAVPALSALAAGGFIYIAMADLVPELHKTTRIKYSLLQLVFAFVGFAAMFGLIFVESGTGHSHGQERRGAHEEVLSDTAHDDEDHSEDSGHSAAAAPRYSVVRVVDGDTLIVHDTHDDEERVRLIGVDAPELDEAACYAREARDALMALAPSGTVVTLVHDETQDARDIYGRVLAYVLLQNGTNINEELIEEGVAREYTYQGNAYELQREFKNDEATAREAGRGLWGVCTAP